MKLMTVIRNSMRQLRRTPLRACLFILLLMFASLLLSLGGSLMGVMGMILFIPLTSVAYTLFREFVYRRLREKGVRVE